jgi:FkbH-like protein
MKLLEAFELINQNRDSNVPVKSFYLACGFTPLHLRTFLQANLQHRIAECRVEVLVGLFGDLAGNLERAPALAAEGTAVVIEWTDLDPRLGLRVLGGWLPETLHSIQESVALCCNRIETALRDLARSSPIAVSLPTLPLPPLDLPPTFQAGSFELELRQRTATFAARICSIASVRIVNPQRLDAISPLSQRFDVEGELTQGFPYRLEHAEKLAELLSSLLNNPPPKKGLITDLDDTCWKGILGEVGVDGISWDLARNSQIHGIYQQFLHSLARRGILVAVASKNDPSLVRQAFQRPDIQLPAEMVFPIEAHWQPKSQSVARIVKTWNIGSDAVVFVDDSPMELAEVQAAHPDLECLLFRKDDPAAVIDLLENLRERFGKASISDEDRIRSQSIRDGSLLVEAEHGDPASFEQVLKNSEAMIDFCLETGGGFGRAFELVNKTNQFNLNGKRYSESAWQDYFEQSGAFLLIASYRDKFGPLGEIAVLMGRKMPDGPLRIDTWVMSCRSFSRRIEHQCLRYLYRSFGVQRIVFDWVQTTRNGPICEFLASFDSLQPDFTLSQERFETLCPPLFHRLQEKVRE